MFKSVVVSLTVLWLIAVALADKVADEHYAQLQTLLVDSKHEQMAAEAAAAAAQANAHQLEMKVLQLQAKVTFLEHTGGGTATAGGSEGGSKLERLVAQLSESLNATEARNRQLELDKDKSWSRAIKAEAKAAKLHAFEATRNATLEHLQKQVASLQNTIQALESQSRLKNQALAASAKRTAWLQEKLTKLAGEMRHSLTVFEQYADVQEVVNLKMRMRAWFADTQEASVTAAMEAANTSTTALELKLLEAERGLNIKDQYVASLHNTVVQSAESLRLLSDKFEELTNDRDGEHFFLQKLEAWKEQQRHQEALHHAQTEALLHSRKSLESNQQLLAGHARLSQAMQTTADEHESSLGVAAERFAELQEKLRLLAGTLSTCDVQLHEYKEEAERAQNWAAVHALNASKIQAETRARKLQSAYDQVQAVLKHAETSPDCHLDLSHLAGVNDLVSKHFVATDVGPSPSTQQTKEEAKPLAAGTVTRRRGALSQPGQRDSEASIPEPQDAAPKVVATAMATATAAAAAAAEAAATAGPIRVEPRMSLVSYLAELVNTRHFKVHALRLLGVVVGLLLLLRLFRRGTPPSTSADSNLSNASPGGAAYRRSPGPLGKARRVSFRSDTTQAEVPKETRARR